MSGNTAVWIEQAKDLSEALVGAARASGASLRRVELSRSQISTVRTGRDGGLHLLAEGHLKLVRFSPEGRALILDLLDPGDLFGVVDAEEEEEGHPTYAQALTPARVETLPVGEIDSLLSSRGALGLALARHMGERRRRLERRLEAQIFQNVATRLAQQLLELADRYGSAAADGICIELRLSQQDLGGLIGASREVVSSTLNQFRRCGAVVSSGRELVVRRRELSAIVAAADWGKNVTPPVTKSVRTPH